MRAVYLILVLGSATWLAAAPIPKALRTATPNDREKLIGTWTMVIISTDTGPVDSDQGLELSVPDATSKVTYSMVGTVDTKCSIIMNPKDSPKSLDWTFDDSGGAIQYKCVYELTDSKLVIVRPLNNTDARPTSCEAGQKGFVFYEYERKK
jgi:uncharacterized protein (TIGR03067 family)